MSMFTDRLRNDRNPFDNWDIREQAADKIEKLEAALRTARGALAWIHNSTEADAIRHRSYEELAAGIYDVAKAALDGEFVDDMHAMEVYDTLYPQRRPR